MADPQNTDALRSNRRYASGNTVFNAISFLVESLMKGEINTCLPVRVVEVFPREQTEEQPTAPDEAQKEDRFPQPEEVGFVSALPLVCPFTAGGVDKPQVLQPALIPRMPYFRLQGGLAAVVNDPQPGDIGIAVFAQQDISRLFQKAEAVIDDDGQETGGAEPQEPVAPATFRTFDLSDGLYIGGILNKAPVAWIKFESPDGEPAEGEDPKISLNVKAVGHLEMKTLDEFYVEAETLMFKTAQGMEFRATKDIKFLAKEEVAVLSQKKVTVNAGETLSMEITAVEFPDDEQPESSAGGDEGGEQSPTEPVVGKITLKTTDGDVLIEAKKVEIKASTTVEGDLDVSGKIKGQSVEAPSVKAGGTELAGHKHTAPNGGGTTSGPL